ncbi:hypothetical protein DT426_13200 [Bacillus cereus]|uniref:Uncharacterized protein n=2 Tax=Bacillus cereus group TaxID=86661 RepID=A0A9W5QU87_BACCE|nr:MULTISPECIES: hypothetical protein [Bacillus cereus group]AZV66578.1 hypothetical protein DT426_13200 [Bacillus cereus]EOP88121.1 hypothetical protein IGM_03110 [Bacillus cereus HuB4-4]MCU4936394.1 hypothetical protein [Bacillus cereus]MCU5188013.1 hypothetical protein [Bacillus cereus]MCU5622788.1 hypothetical protein [Bacillus cereus]
MTDYFKIKSKLRPIKGLPIVLSNKDNEPLESVTKEANRLEVKITTPQIGESITLKSTNYPSTAWWREI